MKLLHFILILSVLSFLSCKKDTKKNPDDQAPPPPQNNCPTCNLPDTAWPLTGNAPRLIFRFVLDSTQDRLNNLGQPSTVNTAVNAAQSPSFNGISAHYIELSPNDITPVGQGLVLYHAPETTCGGSTAIVHCKSVVVKNNEIFFSTPITPTMAGTYKWLRVSLAYQNYDIKIKSQSAGIIVGTIASFVGYNTYVTKFKMKDAVVTPTAGGGPGNKLQGYWGFYTKVFNYPFIIDGQASVTTVVNPNPSSPIPPGSCLVTGSFVTLTNPNISAPLTITGTETSDIVIYVSLSTNKSFEWKELTFDGYFQPDIGEYPVDMGIRGLLGKY
jgi:hypothetical protein